MLISQYIFNKKIYSKAENIAQCNRDILKYTFPYFVQRADTRSTHIYSAYFFFIRLKNSSPLLGFVPKSISSNAELIRVVVCTFANTSIQFNAYHNRFPISVFCYYYGDFAFSTDFHDLLGVF